VDSWASGTSPYFFLLLFFFLLNLAEIVNTLYELFHVNFMITILINLIHQLLNVLLYVFISFTSQYHFNLIFADLPIAISVK